MSERLEKMKATYPGIAVVFALSLLFGNLVFADEIPVGAAGTLKEKVFASQAMPGLAPPYPTGSAHFAAASSS